MISLAAAAALLSTAGTAGAATTGTASVLGHAEIDTQDPASTFEFSVHAQGNGRSGQGVVWMSHHDDTRIGWMVARVDCVRVVGSLGIVTGVVSDAQNFAVASPGEPIALTVRDNGTADTLSFASREQAQRCHRSPDQETQVSRGDFRVSH
jgi:hypothetical protein